MSFLRKVSISKKGSGDSPSSRSSRSEKPPTTRSTSSGSVTTLDSQSSKPKRNLTLKKGKQSLKSLFSSSSLSSDADPKSSPKVGPSHLSISATSSGVTTPTRNGSIVNASSSSKYPDLGVKGKGGPDPQALKDGMDNLVINGASIPVTASPSSSPIDTPRPRDNIQNPSTNRDITPKARPTSMYSQWDEGDESSDDDFISFHTPSEGLSLVEEEEDDQAQTLQNRAPTVSTSVAQPNGIPVEKGVIAETSDVAGTGPSTLRRTKVTTAQTQVQKNHTTAKNALSIDQAAVLSEDLDTCREAVRLFLISKMKEAEELVVVQNPEGNRMYLQAGHGLLNGLKGMMTFDANDLTNALELTKGTTITASALRKPQDGLLTRVGGLIRSGAGVTRVQAMTPLERHAELTYAEMSLMKALLAIFAGGDWLGLVREALNMRTAHGIYRTLQQFIDEADKNGFDDDIDMDFRSGVCLGTGTSSLMLSLLPGKVLKIAEVFGYAGDRTLALQTLMSAGGWKSGSDQPAFGERNEGLRRPVCDMILLSFHLVISVLMPVTHVDVPIARSILKYNMERYPNGIFFLYFQARLHTLQCEPELAIKALQKALDLQLEYVQLQHMCLWDYACTQLMLANWKGALDCFSILKDESNWSRAVYTYASAACVVELIQDENGKGKIEEADKLMKLIPTLTKKIAGKSLPIEKFVSRKGRKFEAQGKKLFLPAMELAYFFGSLGHTPRKYLLHEHIPRIDMMLKRLEGSTPESYGNGHEYWDDYCLGHFLRGVCYATARYQPTEAVESAKAKQPNEPTDDELDHEAEKEFLAVIRHSPDIQLDHFIIYHNHFELGKLYAARGDAVKARQNFEVVMNGKTPEMNQFEKNSKGKYSMEGALLLKTHAALQGVNQGQTGARA